LILVVHCVSLFYVNRNIIEHKGRLHRLTKLDYMVIQIFGFIEAVTFLASNGLD